MQKPEKLRKDQLIHKTRVAQRSAFNGDKIRCTEQQGFDASRRAAGLSVTEGTRPPTPGRVVSRPVCRGIVKPNAAPPLSERQKRMLNGG